MLRRLTRSCYHRVSFKHQRKEFLGCVQIQCKLSEIGLSETALHWFRSYLTGRQQRTSCGNELSDEELPVTHGVPQGSILGPLLLLIYINNLPNVLNSCYASLYADDTVIYCYGTSSKELSEKLNNDLLGVAKWLHDHKLTLNLDKPKCMLIGSNRKRDSKVALTVSILDHSISIVRSFKYLGIHISSDFTWTDHIEHLTGKINQRLGLLKRIKHYCLSGRVFFSTKVLLCPFLNMLI